MTTANAAATDQNPTPWRSPAGAGSEERVACSPTMAMDGGEMGADAVVVMGSSALR
ncbi:MAG: hypothetical protein ACRDN0_21295 [Trebonia sp.]